MNNSPTFPNVERETRVFFWFMTAVLIIMTVVVIVAKPSMRQPPMLISFTGLMAVHIILHWLFRRYFNNSRASLLYMLGQGIIVTILMLIAGEIGVTLGLSMALIGEAIGVYGMTRRGFIVCGYFLMLSLGCYLYIFGVRQIFWWFLAVIPILIFVVIYVIMYTRQTNANERAQMLLTDLENANRKLSEYAAEVEDLTISNERQRMARELHDTLSQGLAGLILQLEAADAHLSSGHTEKARKIVQQTMENARATLANARRAIDDLRENDTLSCQEAIRREVDRFSRATGLSCTLDMSLPHDCQPRMADSLLRIVAEGLANIAHHAQATCVQINIQTAAQELLLEIKDDGKGFDPASVPSGHYGLIGMSERARLAQGSFSVDSQPGVGTTIKVRIPMS
ncbi:MAG TPA: sensor histidine kinase [Anaerolineaceae bacterium]|nr:sensor histidine kinase [Anaerolineaceae bacterium]HPN51987.1 sensor histidine kinase [Anaerolineaceae bacterium]